MSFWESLSHEEKEQLTPYLQHQNIRRGTCIFREDDPARGCYIILEGIIRLEIQHSETESDNVLGHLEGGQLLGEFSLIEPSRRSASAYSETDCQAKWLSTEAYHKMAADLPKIGFKISNALVSELAEKIRKQNTVLAGFLSLDQVDSSTDAMVNRSQNAQPALTNWNENEIDKLIQDIADKIWENAESLASQTVEITRIGNTEDKIQKIYFATRKVAERLQGREANGYLNINDRSGAYPNIQEIGDPAGVVFGLIPITNPVPTIAYKTLISLKSRNALIVSAHRRALPIANQAVDLIREVLSRHGAPEDLVQSIRKRTSRRKTMMFMKHPGVSLILATGGPSMVKAAYSSGTPAIGVGAGNAPVWITKDADLERAARQIVSSKSFDNGVICGSENNLIVDQEVETEFKETLKQNGAHLLNEEEKTVALDNFFDSKSDHLEKSFIGQPASRMISTLMSQKGNQNDAKLLVVPASKDEKNGPLGREKLAPLLSLFTVKNDNEAHQLANALLTNEGMGHTAVIHTSSKEKAQLFGQTIPASRILVNAPSSQGCIGVGTGLFPAFTLGCGTYGGNSTTDNVDYTNVMNVKRLAISEM